MASKGRFPIKIFICYSHIDQAFVDKLASDLKVRGYDIWVDRGKLEGGQSWLAEIENAIERCQVLLVVVSPGAAQSRYVKMEYRYALNEKKIVIPLFLSSQSIPMELSAIQGVNFERHIYEEGLSILLDGLKRFEAPSIPSVSQSSLSQASEILNESPADVLKHGLNPAEVEKSGISDKPILESENDTLGFAPYVEALYEFINSRETTTPLAISINGPWGLGKSSFMGLLKTKLEPPKRNLWGFLAKDIAWHIWSLVTLPIMWITVLLRLVVSEKQAKAIEAASKYNRGLELSTSLPIGLRFLARVASSRSPMDPHFHPTIWFNAWKFSQEEQLWAALASEVLSQLKAKYPWPLRLVFWFKLIGKRAKPVPAFWQVIRNLLPTLFFAIVSALYTVYILPRVSNQQGAPQAAYLLWFITALSALFEGIKNANPFKISLNQVFDNPNYEEKIGYIGRFEKDFQYIVEVVTQLSSKAWETQKLVIFIDDLDRCRPLQAVSIIEAISLFLDSKQCVFVIGMDHEAVVASIETKYKELVEKMRQETPTVVSPGHLFLEKIIQVSLNVPLPARSDIAGFVNSLIEPIKQQNSSSTSSEALSLEKGEEAIPAQPLPQYYPSSSDRGGFGHKDVRDAIHYAAQRLGGNPRKVKRFINIFRLQVYIANKHGLLNELITDNQSEAQGLKPLAILIAWYMQWPEVAKFMSSDTYNPDVYDFLQCISSSLQNDGSWTPQTPNQDDGSQQIITSKFDEIVTALKKKREDKKEILSHWSNLPWDDWLRDEDFRFCFKIVEKLWNKSDTSNEGILLGTLDLPAYAAMMGFARL